MSLGLFRPEAPSSGVRQAQEKLARNYLPPYFRLGEQIQINGSVAVAEAG